MSDKNSYLRRNYAKSHDQRGASTLIISIVVLFATTLVFFGLNSSTLIELKTANNFYFQAKAQEAARGGAEYGLSWITKSSPTWVDIDPTNPPDLCKLPVEEGCRPDATYNEYAEVPRVNPASPNSINGFNIDVRFWRVKPASSGASTVIEVLSVARNGDARAAVRSKHFIRYTIAFNRDRSPPMISNGCISDVTGTPVISVLEPTSTTITSTTPGCVLPGNFNYYVGPPPSGTGSGPSVPPETIKGDANLATSAWDYVFGTSKAEVKAIANGIVNDIYFFDDACPFPCTSRYSNLTSMNWSINLGCDPTRGCTSLPAGTPAKYGIIVVDSTDSANCPKFLGGAVIYGIIYLSQQCSKAPGWGNGTLYGVVITEGNIDKFTANFTLYESLSVNNSSFYNEGSKTVSSVLGSWRDFE
jgi:hypothetical protein